MVYSAVEWVIHAPSKPIEFTEPTSTISRDIENEVAKNGSVRFDIGSMCINNPENIDDDNASFKSSLSMLVVDSDKTQTLNVNIRSPLQYHVGNRQGDILVYIPDVVNIHYEGNIKDYIEIKDSPNKYYIQNGVRFHSYVADIYVNKNNDNLNFGSNTHVIGKNRTEEVNTQQIK